MPRNGRGRVVLLAMGMASLWGCSENPSEQQIIAMWDGQEDTVRPANASDAIALVQAEEGVLVFANQAELRRTARYLNSLEPEARAEWNRARGFVSMEDVFNSVVEAENSLSDAYELAYGTTELPASGPTLQPIHSREYEQALSQGLLRVVQETDGEYFDYNLSDTMLASVFDARGMVRVGKEIYRNALPAEESLPKGRLLAQSALEEPGDEPEIPLPPSIPTNCYSSTRWTVYSLPNNGWKVYSSGKRRVRAWIEGASCVSPNEQQLYVTQSLRVQGQKKNFWGNWKFAEAYTASAKGTWTYQYYRYYENRFDGLPAPVGTYRSPLNWIIATTAMNNATLPLDPHVDGYYYNQGDSLYGRFASPVSLKNADLDIVINGQTLFLNSGP